MAWLSGKGIPKKYDEQAGQERLVFLSALKEGAIKCELILNGRAALVVVKEGCKVEVSETLGFRLAPVVIMVREKPDYTRYEIHYFNSKHKDDTTCKDLLRLEPVRTEIGYYWYDDQLKCYNTQKTRLILNVIIALVEMHLLPKE